MNGRTKKSWRARIWIGMLLYVGISIALTSCTKFFAAPRQGWNKSLGPVVPHDKFPADCSLCHTGGNWTTIRKDFTFDHEAQTGVPLKGAHANVACLMCHNDRGPVAVFAAQGCAGCHQDPHRSNMGKGCIDCHNENTWQPVEMISKHNRTRFPLVGAHAAAACYRCHPGAQVNNFEGADTTCTTCHQADLARATSPDHVAQNWTTDCQRCHTPTGWKPALFKHPSSFPLSGGHAGQDCTACHVGGVFTGLSTTCSSCHLDDYQQTTNPNHALAGFSTDCASCHSTATWLGARINHPSSFPLTAGHAGRRCTDCHTGGVFTGLSTDCASCHLDDFQKTTNPNHVTSGFDTNCRSCHNTSSWRGAMFNHPSTFPLTAGHSGRSCTDCHTGGVYTGLSTTCSSCHLDDYQRTTNPNHTASGFGTDCTSCHTTQTWQGAVFNHTFPITSGPHKLACNQCHLNSANFAEFSCINCHEHSPANTNNDHREVSGYSYNSAACFQCHPRGRH